MVNRLNDETAIRLGLQSYGFSEVSPNQFTRSHSLKASLALEGSEVFNLDGPRGRRPIRPVSRRALILAGRRQHAKGQ